MEATWTLIVQMHLAIIFIVPDGVCLFLPTHGLPETAEDTDSLSKCTSAFV